MQIHQLIVNRVVLDVATVVYEFDDLVLQDLLDFLFHLQFSNTSAL